MTDSEQGIRGALVVLKILKILFATINILLLELIASLQMPSEMIPNSACSSMWPLVRVSDIVVLFLL